MMREDGGLECMAADSSLHSWTVTNLAFIRQQQPSKSVVHLTDTQNNRASRASADSNMDAHIRAFMYVWLVVMFFGRLIDIA
jgi:hypothetical protein